MQKTDRNLTVLYSDKHHLAVDFDVVDAARSFEQAKFLVGFEINNSEGFGVSGRKGPWKGLRSDCIGECRTEPYYRQ